MLISSGSVRYEQTRRACKAQYKDERVASLLNVSCKVDHVFDVFSPSDTNLFIATGFSLSSCSAPS